MLLLICVLQFIVIKCDRTQEKGALGTIYHFVKQAITVEMKKRYSLFFFTPDETSILPLHVDQI